jgi:hypothetical protein
VPFKFAPTVRTMCLRALSRVEDARRSFSVPVATLAYERSVALFFVCEHCVYR